MKYVKSVAGYVIKQFTETDVKRGNCMPHYLGEYAVLTRDGDKEYEGIERLWEAEELAHGLRTDRQKEVKL